MIVTQPRRIAALALSRRVAEQRQVELGTSVGYRLGQGDREDSKNTSITFVTVGYLLQYLAHKPSYMERYTHVVLDEVHERSMDMDLLNLLIKKLLKRSTTKIVVMSATLQAGLFGEYFASQHETVLPAIFVGAKCFPVEKIYLEDMLEAIPTIKKVLGSTVCRLVKTFESDNMGKGLKAEVSPVICNIICHLVCHLAQSGECILVFLPGMGEIEEIQDLLESFGGIPIPLQILVLHSMVPNEEQDLIMCPAPDGHCKIILSTNIAESSITIPDVRIILDSGVQRSILYDDTRQMSNLMRTWCPQSSATQRAGRAGRVAPGKIFYLYTRAFHDTRMPEFETPEMNRVSLEHTVLQVKLLFSKFGSTTHILSKAMTSPPKERVVLAIKKLYEFGAINSNDESAQVSRLGRLAASLPIDLVLVKLILLGHTFGLLAEAIIMAAALSLQDVFAMPSRLYLRNQQQYIESLQQNFTKRFKYDNGCYSEPLTYLAVYHAWLLSDKRPHSASKLGLSYQRMPLLDRLVADLCGKIENQMFADSVDEDEQAPRVRCLLEAAHARRRSETLGHSMEIRTLLRKDINLLRFIIAGAFSHIFLRGTVSQNDSVEVETMGLDPSRTIILSRLSKEAALEHTLLTALKSVSVQHSAIHKIKAKTFIEVASVQGDSRSALSFIEDTSFSCKFLSYIYFSSKRTIVLPNPNYRPGSAESEEITIDGLRIDRHITWRLFDATQDVMTESAIVVPYHR